MCLQGDRRVRVFVLHGIVAESRFSISSVILLKNMAGKELGKVVHWYDKIGVAVVKLAGALKVGDKIKVSRGGTEFEETVSSMQLEHQPVDGGKKGQEVAIKLSQAAKDGAVVSKVE